VPDQYQDVSWPGVLGIASMTGTISHGIRPSTFVLITLPQVDAPAMAGDLVFSDRTNGIIRLRDCTVDRITSNTDGSGTVWRLEILDRRWRWVFGQISGNYNQKDTRGKLVPWSIRSPTELARLCLRAMGERDFVVDLPPGLPAQAGVNLDRFLRLGENFPQALSNPQTEWVGVPPAEALARLADRYGRRVVFQPITNRVAILQPGTGRSSWPEAWGAESVSPSLDPPDAPSAVGVIGAPIRVQMRFQLVPVGEEWDGSYLPIDQLSYAPASTRQNQITDVTFTSDAVVTFKLFVNDQFLYPSGTGAAAIASAITQVNANAELNTVCKAAATADPEVLRLTGLGFVEFTVTASVTDPGAEATVEGIQPAINQGRSWATSVPGQHYDVQATERLNFYEARQKAVNSVWRCYRIAMTDPRGKELAVPGFGVLKRRQQIVLQPTKVDQVVPEPRDKDGNLIRARVQGVGGVIPEFYNGYSRDQAATVSGSVAKTIGAAFWLVEGDGDAAGGNNPLANTPVDKKVFVPFEVDPVEQMIVFAEPVYYRGAGGTVLRPQSLVLETACLIQYPDTSAFWRATRTKPVGGNADVEWRVFDDVEYALAARYEDLNAVKKWDVLDFGDATQRADTYLTAMANRYQVVGGETRRFIGLYPVEPDGSVQQVTWEIGPGGCATTASLNAEHSSVIPPYPARRRVENLSPNAQAALANLTDRGGQVSPSDAVRIRARGLT
jgi:hypothetical protein